MLEHRTAKWCYRWHLKVYPSDPPVPRGTKEALYLGVGRLQAGQRGDVCALQWRQRLHLTHCAYVLPGIGDRRGSRLPLSNPLYFSKDFIYLFLERGEERKRGRETSVCGCLLHTPYWDLACHPGMCPDWESNW